MNDVCPIALLKNAVASRLSVDEEAELHLHLEHCEACCAQLEQLAGGEAWRHEAAAMLTTDELDTAVPEPAVWSDIDFSVEHLDPSSDANVLGRLGGYDVMAIVGRGGMGVVLKAFDRELKRFVAIKALAPHLVHSSVARKRFAREAQAAAAVVNPHVIAILHVQPTGRLPFLIMPLLTGESLAQRLKARGTLELTEVLRIGMQAAAGLAAAHDQGLVHRDVKPANIFLEMGVERVVITDFGLARAADDVSMTRQGVVAGTPEYMSPEQARGEALDGRSDLFSLGCVLYEAATGVSPFRADSTMATLRRIVDEPPAAMASLAPELPSWFSHIVERLLSKDPTQRSASAGELSQLLEQCLSHLQQPTSAPLPASLVAHAADRRWIFDVTRKGLFAMLGTIGMTLLGMVLWLAPEPPDISGQWTSDEWGAVVLEAKQPGQYEGTFTGSHNDKPAYEITEIPVVSMEGYGTQPVLTKTESGTIQLKWSRVERRFNGTWRKGITRSGKMSLRVMDNEIRGAWTTSKDAQKESDSPRLADLLWKRSEVIVTADAEYQQLQRAEDFLRALGIDGAANAEELERFENELDARKVFTPKYLAFEEKHRGTTAGFEALNKVVHFARSVGDPTCVAAKGRVEAVDRLIKHYARHDGIEKTFDAFLGGPDVPRHKEFLQTVFEENASRHVQAEALVAQLELIRVTLKAHAMLPNSRVLVSQHPTPRKAGLQSQLEILERVVPDELLAESKDIIEQLKSYGQLAVARYGTAHAAAEHLSHAINRVIVGKPAPEIKAITSTGEVFQLSKLRGATVLLVFARNHSDNDVMYEPLRQLAADYKERRVEVVMILAGDRKQNQSAAALKRDLPWTVIPQPQFAPLTLDWGVTGIPAVHIIDAKGILQSPIIGMPSYDDDSGYDTTEVAAALDTLLKDHLSVSADDPEARPGAIDTGNARSVVEAYVASALAGDVAGATALAKNSPADPKRIAEIPEFLNVKRLKFQTVYVNEPAKPTRALATSEAVKLDEDHKEPSGRRDGFMVFTLELSDGKWLVVDIDFESKSGAEKELKRFLEANASAMSLPARVISEAARNQLAENPQADARDAGIAKLALLLEQQRVREKSVSQLRMVGNIRQSLQIDTERREGESNEDFIKRYTSREMKYDGIGPTPMTILRDYKADLGHVKFGDIHGKLPIMYREWFFRGDVFTQLRGVEAGRCQATITRKPAVELRQPWSGWIRADLYAFRPIRDHVLSTVLDKAAHTPGVPDPGGRPLFHLEKKESTDHKTVWIATFLHQEPSEVSGRTAVEQLWYRVFWEQLDEEVVIRRVDELSVVGGADAMPARIALIEDYRKIDGKSIPHRVRTFMFFNPTGMLGAEFVASEIKINDSVVVPRELQIPPGTSVTDELTGKRYRQPAAEPKSEKDSTQTPIGDSEGSTTINPDVPATGKRVDKDKLLNDLRERDRKFSRRSVELERTWDTLTSPGGEAAQNRHNSIRFGQGDPGIPKGLPEDYQQPHRIRYLWTGQDFESTLEVLADVETAIHPEHGKLAARSIESDCFNYYRYWNRDTEIFSHSSDIAKLNAGKKAWEYLLPSGFGFTPSILRVSNAVEVDDGYVLKGLVGLPSATIGNRKNCFELHIDKELILRKAVIQYHVYDFVIVTSGRSEDAGMPPLAKHAAVSIYHIGQDEKRSGDIGNYKYEAISLSEKLTKAEYDLRVNFAIPKGTKLSAGLNLVEVNLQGLPGVTQVERDAPAPRPKMTPREQIEAAMRANAGM